MCKKNSTDKTQGVQSSGSKNHWETIYSTSFDIILYPETCFTTLQELHLSNAIHEVHLQGLSLSTVEQQINDAHFAVVLGTST